MGDFQFSDLSSEDEMLDDVSQSSHDQLASLPRTSGAVATCSSEPDRSIPPAVHASKDSAGTPSSHGFAEDLENPITSVHPQLRHEIRLEDVTTTGTTNVLAKIESVFEAMADVLLNERGQLSIELATRSRVSRQYIDPLDSTTAQSIAVQRLFFPGKSEREAWRFGERVRLRQCVRPLTTRQRS